MKRTVVSGVRGLGVAVAALAIVAGGAAASGISGSPTADEHPVATASFGALNEPTETPEPSETAEPVGTPEPAETAEPVETAEPSETAEPKETEEADDQGEDEQDEAGTDGHATSTAHPGDEEDRSSDSATSSNGSGTWSHD